MKINWPNNTVKYTVYVVLGLLAAYGIFKLLKPCAPVSIAVGNGGQVNTGK